jgi:ATP-dependent DNA helicase MPH1
MGTPRTQVPRNALESNGLFGKHPQRFLTTPDSAQMEMSVAMAYHTLQGLVQGVDKDGKTTAIKPQQSKILKDPHYTDLMKEIERQCTQQGHFPMHPKMDKLRTIAVQYFARAQMNEDDRVQADGAPNPHTPTGMIIFCSYRECVEQIVEMLNEEQPMIRAHKFIGQSTDKRGGKGATQKVQLEVRSTTFVVIYCLMLSEGPRGFQEW